MARQLTYLLRHMHEQQIHEQEDADEQEMEEYREVDRYLDIYDLGDQDEEGRWLHPMERLDSGLEV
jgi:hypothetical protein